MLRLGIKTLKQKLSGSNLQKSVWARETNGMVMPMDNRVSAQANQCQCSNLRLFSSSSTCPGSRSQNYHRPNVYTSQLRKKKIFSDFGEPHNTSFSTPSVSLKSFSTTTCSEEGSHKIGRVNPKLGIMYKCKICGQQNAHSFSKKSYEEGVVIVKCKGCQSNHLIADNLGWFEDVKGRNIEEMLAEKGEEVQKLKSGSLDIPEDMMQEVFNKHKETAKDSQTVAERGEPPALGENKKS